MDELPGSPGEELVIGDACSARGWSGITILLLEMGPEPDEGRRIGKDKDIRKVLAKCSRKMICIRRTSNSCELLYKKQRCTTSISSYGSSGNNVYNKQRWQLDEIHRAEAKE